MPMYGMRYTEGPATVSPTYPNIPPLGGRGGAASREELICILTMQDRVPRTL